MPRSLTMPTPSSEGKSPRRHFQFKKWTGLGLVLVDETPILQVTE